MQQQQDATNGQSPESARLFEAVAKGAVGQVDKMLSRGVFPDSRDIQGKTPLIVSSEAGNAALIGVLLRHGADLNSIDVEGETALMKAARHADLDMTKLLVTKGADLFVRNNGGLTASEIAREAGASEVATFLFATALTPIPLDEIAVSPGPKPDDDGPTTPSAAAPMPENLESASKSHKTLTERDSTGEGLEEESSTDQDHLRSDGDSSIKGSGEAANSSTTIPASGVARRQKTQTGVTLPENVIAADEERIVFDEWDNRQIQSINEKIRKVLDKAGREIGDHTIDTVFKGSYMAVLKPRSQEYKRFRKLWKHRELLIDPRRWREWTGGAAVRRYSLAEGIDVSSLSMSHLIELYYVRDLKLILTLAEEAINYNYTLRQLKKAIEELREHDDDQDPGKVIIKTLDQTLPLLEDPDLMDLCKDKDRVFEELSKAERKKIRALIKARKPGLDEWKNLMDTFEGILTDLEKG